MGKRSSFAHRKNDAYLSWDLRAGRSIRTYIAPGTRFAEVCAGRGDLVRQLEGIGLDCVAAYDLEPQSDWIATANALALTVDDLNGAQCIVTNPPWTRDILHSLIRHLVGLAPTWLLFDADWMFSKQSQELMRFCAMVVPIGRMRWIENTSDDALDNCAWYFFPDFKEKDTIFQTFKPVGGPYESFAERRERINSQLMREVGLDHPTAKT